MEINFHSLSQDMKKHYRIMQEIKYDKDINSVFVPFRPILEMELVLCSLLAKFNYETLSKLPYTSLDVPYILNELGISDESVFKIIIERFFKTLQKIVPLANYSRNIEKHSRYGNVNAYTKSRVPVFYAIDRLKFKLILLRNLLSHLRSNHYLLSAFPSFKQKNSKSFETILFAEYCARMWEYFETVSWEPEYQSKFFKKENQINHKILHELNRFQMPKQNMNVIFIMRSVRASYLLSKILFKMMDVETPFIHENESIEPIILNREIIPGMLSAINDAFRIGDSNKIRELVDMFENYLSWMIEGLNHGYCIASNYQIKEKFPNTLYYSGDILKF